ncbi:MAG: hypothetical protein F7C82_06140 [Desulfurococcales archaeon]|nr:hypothetical protein [Desulfurococcales archaeon]MCE4622893.1 hypothetical protein [Desulfurococcales archaeon]MCE4626699.1 hypothetical protein [Desulfurococcales archaeon]MCE4629840.1 hypothetical protein [Desulfurococcales archaeon]NOZ31113.1 hypothetical protein [Thermoproteota archaeon]
MTLVSHSVNSLPKIKVKLTGIGALHLTKIAWRVAERLWRNYGIDIEVEDDPFYLVNPTFGVGLGTGGMHIIVEDPRGTPHVYDIDVGEAEEAVERLENLVLGVITNGVPVLDSDLNDSIIDRDIYVDLAIT